MRARPECGERVYWYDGGCELPEGHDGPHWDGMSWFNDDKEEVGNPDPPAGWTP